VRAFALVVLAACTGGKNNVPPEPAPVPAPEPEAVAVVEEVAEPSPAEPTVWGDTYTVMGTPSLKGLALTVDVRYGGGCETHEFTTRAMPRTSDGPTRQPIVLHHDAHNDTCRALKYEHLTIPLDNLIGEDCTESVRLIAPIGESGKTEIVLPLSRPMGCA